jgi:hypothetical protein
MAVFVLTAVGTSNPTWRKYTSHLLHVDRFNDVLQTEYIQLSHWHLSVSSLEVEIAIEKVKGYESPGVDQISPKLIQTRV